MALPLGEPPSLCSHCPQSPSALQKLVETGVLLLLPTSPALCVPRGVSPYCAARQVMLLPCSLVAPQFSPFRGISLCSGWALGIEDVLLGAWETHGNPRSVQGRGRAFSHLLWLYFPTEHLQEENYILRDLVLNKAIFLISLQARKSYCSPPWLVGKLRRSAGSREGPAEFRVLTVTQRLCLHLGL